MLFCKQELQFTNKHTHAYTDTAAAAKNTISFWENDKFCNFKGPVQACSL